MWRNHLRCSLGAADERMFMKVPSLPSAMLTSAVSVGQGARSPARAKSQLVQCSEVKGPGCGWCTPTPTPITHWWGLQTAPGERSPKRQLGFGQRGFHGCASLHLSYGPGINSGLGDINALGHGERI